MTTRVVNAAGQRPGSLDEEVLAQAVREWLSGELVAIPTETVYGLGADARNPEALQKIFTAKGRPSDHPLIVHLAPGADVHAWAAQWPAQAQALADAFWPGPLTLIVRKQADVPDEVTGGQGTVGLRCPSHPVAQALLSAFDEACSGRGGIAAPSANRFGRISPTHAEHVLEELDGRVSLIVDGGESGVGIESTIVDVSRGFPVLLRPGHITAAQIEAVLGQTLARPDAAAPRVSGSLEQHYAPGTPMQTVPILALGDTVRSYQLLGITPVAVLVRTPLRFVESLKVQQWVLGSDPHEVAHHLYDAMRAADHAGVKRIFVEQMPTGVQWEGINDRLRRACAAHTAE